MAQKLIQLNIPHRMWERIRQYALDEGIVNHKGEPVITRGVFSCISTILTLHEEEGIEGLREETGASTTGIMKVATRNHVETEKKRRKGNY